MDRIYNMSSRTKIFICIILILGGLLLLGYSVNKTSSEYIGEVDATILDMGLNKDFDSSGIEVILDCNGTIVRKTFSLKTPKYQKAYKKGDKMKVKVYLCHKDGKTYKVVE